MNYIIFTINRSGSTLLCKLISQIHHLQDLGEYYNDDITDQQYNKHQLTVNSSYCIKVFPNHFYNKEYLWDFYLNNPNFKIIVLKRLDVKSHFLSYAKSWITNKWHPSPVLNKKVTVSKETFNIFKKRFIKLEKKERLMSNFDLFYFEDFEHNYNFVTKYYNSPPINFHNLPSKSIQTTFEWVKNMDEINEWFRNNPEIQVKRQTSFDF